MKYLITSLHLFLVLLTACKGQTNYSAQTLEKIREVENNVTGNLILNDEPPSTILERMQKYNAIGKPVQARSEIIMLVARCNRAASRGLETQA